MYDESVTADGELCALLRGWDRLERRLGQSPVVDFDVSGCGDVRLVRSRGDVLAGLERLREHIGDPLSLQRLDAHEHYVRALMGQRFDFASYIGATQHIPVRAYTPADIAMRRAALDEALDASGLRFSAHLERTVARKDSPVQRAAVPRTFRELFQTARRHAEALIGIAMDFRLKINTAKVNAYWGYWVDGTRERFRLRFNRLPRKKGLAECVQFVYHELVGHCGQIHALRRLIDRGEIPPSYGITCVHGPEQFLFEGLAQSWPLWAVAPELDSSLLRARVVLARYRGVIEHNAHLMLNEGANLEDCVDFVVTYAPFIDRASALAGLRSRSVDPLLRSYQFVYGSSLDLFAEWALTLDDEGRRREFVRTCYSGLLTYDRLVQEFRWRHEKGRSRGSLT